MPSSNRSLKKALQVHGWNALSASISNAAWLAMFYTRVTFEKTGKYNYAWQSFFEGLASDIVAFPFSVQAQRVNGATTSEALKKALAYVPAFFPLDCLFQATEDWIIAVNKDKALLDVRFEEYADPTLGALEVGMGAAVYMGGFSLFYYMVSKITKAEVDICDALKLGVQYFCFYLTDSFLNTELDPFDRGVRDLFFSALIQGVLSFSLDSLPDIARALKLHLMFPLYYFASQRSLEVNSMPNIVVSPNEERNALREFFKEESEKSAEIFVGTVVWIAVYYTREHFESLHDNKNVGYALNDFSEGLLSNVAAAMLAVGMARMRNEDLHQAMRDALKYILIYLPLDGAYQLMEDYVIAVNQSDAVFDIDFELYADPTFEKNEVLAATTIFLAGYGALYYGMSKLIQSETSIKDALLIGSQYYVFYLTDAVFDIELDPVERGIQNLFLSSLAVSAYSFISATLANLDVWRWLIRKPVQENPLEQIVVESPSLSQPLLTNRDQSDDQDDNRQAGCWARFFNRLPSIRPTARAQQSVPQIR